MRYNVVTAAAICILLVFSGLPGLFQPGEAGADPFVPGNASGNGDGTAMAVWDFVNDTQYSNYNTTISALPGGSSANLTANSMRVNHTSSDQWDDGSFASSNPLVPPYDDMTLTYSTNVNTFYVNAFPKADDPPNTPMNSSSLDDIGWYDLKVADGDDVWIWEEDHPDVTKEWYALSTNWSFKGTEVLSGIITSIDVIVDAKFTGSPTEVINIEIRDNTTHFSYVTLGAINTQTTSHFNVGLNSVNDTGFNGYDYINRENPTDYNLNIRLTDSLRTNALDGLNPPGTGHQGNLSIDRLKVKFTTIQYETAVTYTSAPIDAGSPAHWEDMNVSHSHMQGSQGGQSTNITVHVRTANTLAALTTATWVGPYFVPPGDHDISAVAPGRYMQYKVDLSTKRNDQTPTVHSIAFRYWKYAFDGYVQTGVYTPPHGFLYLDDLTYEGAPRGGGFSFNYSTNGGTTWIPVTGFANNKAVLGVGPIRDTSNFSTIIFRATIFTYQTADTPLLHNFRLNYTFDDEPVLERSVAAYHGGLHFAGSGRGYDMIPKVVAGDLIILKARARNVGNGTANISAWLDMDPNLEYYSDTSGVTHDVQTIGTSQRHFWNFTDVPETAPANERSFAITLIVRGGRDNGTMTGTVIHIDGTSALGNKHTYNSSSIQALIVAPEMTLAAEVPEQPNVDDSTDVKTVILEDNFHYMIHYNVTGSADAHKVRVSMTPDEGMEYISSNTPIDPKRSSLATGDVTWTIGEIDKDNATQSIIVEYRVSDPNYRSLSMVPTIGLSFVDNSSALIGSLEVEPEPVLIVNRTQVGPLIIEDKIPRQVKPEDSVTWNLDFVLLDAVIDQDAVTLPANMRWYLEEYDESLYTVAGNGGTLLAFTPKPDEFGTDHPVLNVTDEDGNYDTMNLTVKITPMNDRPEIGEFDAVRVHYDSAHLIPLEGKVIDIDTPKASLVYSVDDPQGAGYATFTEIEGEKALSLEYPESLIDKSFAITLKVRDEENETSASIPVTVTSNYPPIFAPLPDQTLDDGETKERVLSLLDYVSDQDHPTGPFAFEATGYDTGALDVVIIDDGTWSVSLTALSQRTVTESVTFTVMDPAGARASSVMKVEIFAENNPPEIATIPTLYVPTLDLLTTAGLSAYVFDLFPYVRDPDNTLTELEYTLSGELVDTGPDFAAIRGVGAEDIPLELRFPAEEAGKTYTMRLNVSDGLTPASEVPHQDIEVKVIDTLPPMFNGAFGDVTMDEDVPRADAFSIASRVDQEGTLAYQAFTRTSLFGTDTEWVSAGVDAAGSVSFSTSIEHSNGEAIIVVRVTDMATGAFAEDTLLLTVEPVNDAPVIDPAGFIDLNVTEGNDRVIMWNNWVYDPDLNKSIPQVDTGQSLGASTDWDEYFIVAGFVLLLEPVEGMAGEHEFNLTVSDGELQDTLQVTVEVNALPPSGNGDTPDTLSILLPYLILIALLIVISIAAYVAVSSRYRVNEIFLIHKKGNLVAHATAKRQSAVDEEILSGMFTAVQDFIKDSFQDRSSDDDEAFSLDELKLGDQNILLERSPNTFIAVIFEGNSRVLRKRTKKVLDDVEDQYGKHLTDWDGNMSYLRGTTELISTLLTLKKGQQRGGDDIGDAGPAMGESIDKYISGGTDQEGLPGPGPAAAAPDGLPGGTGVSPMELLKASEGGGAAGPPPAGALAPGQEPLALPPGAHGGGPGAMPAVSAALAATAPGALAATAPGALAATPPGVLATAPPGAPAAASPGAPQAASGAPAAAASAAAATAPTGPPTGPAAAPATTEAPATPGTAPAAAAPTGALGMCVLCKSPIDDVSPGAECPFCGTKQ